MAMILTWVIAFLAFVASAGGLFMDGLYRETEWALPQTRGQDLLTLAILPVLLAAARSARRGSTRATMIWIGLLGYIFYTYTGAAFAYTLNKFFLIYVALFSSSVFALGAAARSLDLRALAAQFDEGVPRRAVIAYLIFIAVMLSALWLGQLAPFLLNNTLPEGVVRGGNGMIFVYVMDLGLVVPLALLSAGLLGRRSPWGNILAGCLLIKATTMGLALLSMTWFFVRSGQPLDWGLTAVWIGLAGSGLAMSTWFLRHCRS